MKYKSMNFEKAMELGFKEDLTEWPDYEYTHGVFLMDGDVPVEMIGSDGGEPEDQTLWRDWKWVAPALNKAYEDGSNGLVTKDIWIVVSNTDRTEGRGRPVTLHYCLSQTTAIRLSEGKGVQGSYANVQREKAFVTGENWYTRVHVEHPTNADVTLDEKNRKVNEARKKAIALGLSEEEIDLLSSELY